MISKHVFPFLFLAAAAPLTTTQSALTAARQSAAADKAAVATASAKARGDAAAAALLAERQVAAAAALRGMEDATAADAASLASLQTQAARAAARLRQDEAALTVLLPALQRLSAQPAAALLAAPGAPTDAVRGVLIMQGLAAAIGQRAAAVTAGSSRVFALLDAARARRRMLDAAVAAQAAAEVALDGQIAAARAAEMADADIVLAAAAAAAAADTRVHDLRGMVARLLAGPPADDGAAVGPVGAGRPPVAGTMVQGFGAATLAGPAEGVSFRAAPGAQVVAPCAGPVRFAGNFPNYGMLVIVDCGAPYMFVLSGMQRLDVAAGQRVAGGQPVGEMQPYDAKAPSRLPLLYVELRRDGVPANPAPWLTPPATGH